MFTSKEFFLPGLTCALADDVAEPFGYFLHAVCTGNSDRVADKLILFNTVCESS